MTLDTSSTLEALDGGLFQSEAWAKFQTLAGHPATRFSGEHYRGVALTEHLPGVGHYLFVPRGPVLVSGEDTSFVTEELLGLARKEKAGWIRVEPQTDAILSLLKKYFGEDQVVPAPKHINPREILMAPLVGTSEEWLSAMKPKTRYNIRLAEKSGVTVRFSREEKDMEAFLRLIGETAKRQGIRIHPLEYYRTFLRAFSEHECTLALAEKDGVLLATSLIVFFGPTAYYLHGGSSDVERGLMAPYLLHFRTMEEAKRRGCTKYDFGGVRVRSKENTADSDWAGITRFKQGFAPTTETVLFPGTFDVILSPMRYKLYKSLRHLVTLRKFLSKITSR